MLAPSESIARALAISTPRTTCPSPTLRWRANIYTATGDATTVRALLAADPERANAPGGPPR